MITVPQKLLLSPDGLEEECFLSLSKLDKRKVRESLLELFEEEELSRLYSIRDIDTNLSGGQEQGCY